MALRVLVGVDLVRVDDFGRRLGDPAFRERAFSPDELADDRVEHLAGLFAAKEACFKALGMPERFREVAVRTSERGRPRLCLRPAPPGLLSADVSIAHADGYATAVVVALVEESAAAEDEECR